MKVKEKQEENNITKSCIEQLEHCYSTANEKYRFPTNGLYKKYDSIWMIVLSYRNLNKGHKMVTIVKMSFKLDIKNVCRTNQEDKTSMGIDII